jgi:hypothetical protein
VSVVELSDEENVAILAEAFTESLSDIGDKTQQIAVLKRLYELLDSSTPKHYIYETDEGCDELEVIRVGGDQRIFCRLVMGIPHGDKHYNVLLVFYVDPHRYRSNKLAAFDEAAKQRLDEIASFDAVDAVDDYLEVMDAFTVGSTKTFSTRSGMRIRPLWSRSSKRVLRPTRRGQPDLFASTRTSTNERYVRPSMLAGKASRTGGSSMSKHRRSLRRTKTGRRCSIPWTSIRASFRQSPSSARFSEDRARDASSSSV